METGKDKNYYDSKIGTLIKGIIERSAYNQKDVANHIGINPATMSQMLTGNAALPIERFFQIVGYLNPDRQAVNEIFALYQQKLAIPANAIAMLDGGWILQRYKKLMEIPEAELTEINRKEIEVIRYWNGITEGIPAVGFNARLQEYVKNLDEVQSETALKVLVAMFGKG